jgi:HlyD family secretion protein
MNPDKLSALQIPPEDKQRPRGSLFTIFLLVSAFTIIAACLSWPRASDSQRASKLSKSEAASATAPVVPGSSSAPAASSDSGPAPVASTNAVFSPANDDIVLTVSGYIINRERIELSPRFMGTVKWIGVKKGDVVTNGQVVVLLDDTEYKARLDEAEGHLATAKANVHKARTDADRMAQLIKTQTESQKSDDDARLNLEAAEAALKEAEGTYEIAKTYFDWTVIRSPINGVVLDKLVQPNELVMPQSFGGAHGPSTALIAVADPLDLQVEIDLGESDLAKVTMGQKCRVIPEAYQDKVYKGEVAEIAPEANRQKGTLQVKVQIHNPDHFLTPELSAKVEFLK